MTTNADAASYSWPLLIEAQGQLVRASQPPLLAELVEPVDLFAKLVREVEAGQALIALAMTEHEQRMGALDALALARDVLDDARRELVAAGFPAGGSSSTEPAPGPDRKISGEPPEGFVTSRTSCACGDVDVDDDEVAVVLGVGDELGHARTACLHVGHWSGQHDGCDRSVCEARA